MIMLMTTQKHQLRDGYSECSLVCVQYFRDTEIEDAQAIEKAANDYYSKNLPFLQCRLEQINCLEEDLDAT